MGFINFITYLLITVAIYGIMAIGLNLQYGYTGLLNFGYVGFFCAGAYVSALVTKAGAPFIVGIILAAAFAGLLGFLISLPTARLSVHYWAIITLGAGEIIRLVVNEEEWLTRGTFGIASIPKPLGSLVPPNFYQLFYLLLCFFFLMVMYLLVRRLVKAPFGRVLKAMREDEDLPLSMGKNVFRFKIKVLALGSAYAGASGSLYAHYLTYISPLNFMPMITFIVWAMVIVGGKANNLGAIVGTAIVIALFNSTRFLKDVIPISTNTIASVRMMLIGALIVVILLLKSEGLVPEPKRKYEPPEAK